MVKDYFYWKKNMTQFFKSIDYDLWEVIHNGYHILTKVEKAMTFPKLSHEWNELEKRNVQLNAKLYIIFIVNQIEMNIIGSLKTKWQNIFRGA